MASRLVQIGVFGAPHGVRGELRVKSFTADPQALAGYQPLTDEAGARRFEVASARLLKDDMLVVRLKDVADRDAAAALTGVYNDDIRALGSLTSGIVGLAVNLAVFLIVSAVITPSTDPFNMAIVAVPLLILYEAGIIISMVFAKRPIEIAKA